MISVADSQYVVGLQDEHESSAAPAWSCIVGGLACTGAVGMPCCSSGWIISEWTPWPKVTCYCCCHYYYYWY